MRVCICIRFVWRELADLNGLVLIYGMLFVFWMAVWHMVRMYVRPALTSFA